MKKKIGAVCVLASVVIGASVALAACGSGGNNEALDATRTQLYVYNYDGGFGSEWLTKAKTRYEALHAEDSYEEGKQGIQIMISNSKTKPEDEAILTNTEEVYFTEGIYYYTLKNKNIFADITAAVTGANPYETGKTVESKFTQQQKNFYNTNASTGGAAQYYGIPHYSGTYGLIYNIDLFEEKGYYFLDVPTDDETLEGKFDYYGNGKRSAGPDGEYETDDDGLPATYEEFFDLCDYIASTGDTPVAWTGQYYNQYLNGLLGSLIADFEGLDQMMLRYTFDGEATDLGTVSGNTFVKNSATTNITAANGYELARQEGVYRALEFIRRLETTAKYHNSMAFNTTHSHMDAQDDFLYAGNDGKTAPIAMLVDGTWWESEATNTFNKMATSVGADYSKNNRHFGWMPLPKANAQKVDGSKNVLTDTLNSLCFVKRTIADWKLPIAIDFLQFVNTDASLTEFTLTTNAAKALNYTVADMSGMSPFGQNMMKYRQNAEILYPYASNSFYLNHESDFTLFETWKSTVSGSLKNYPAQTFHESSITAAEYFTGIYTYYENFWNLNYKG